MSDSPPPTCWIIAGPNGAGKTTFALRYLPEIANCQNFINADLIAAGLAPLAPESQLVAASRLFLAEINARVRERENFAFETTLAGRSYIKLIRRLKAAGWRVELIYLALSDVSMSRMRVAERVAHGGHNIPLDDIERRFPRSLRNLLVDFASITDRTQCFMNNGEIPEPVFVQQGADRIILNNELFEHLEQTAEL
ncbi:MAG: zeta toxin family protein [Cyanobacteria bacterium P01_F01_bin.3]